MNVDMSATLVNDLSPVDRATLEDLTGIAWGADVNAAQMINLALAFDRMPMWLWSGLPSSLQRWGNDVISWVNVHTTTQYPRYQALYSIAKRTRFDLDFK
jgi:hypothetical protein